MVGVEAVRLPDPPRLSVATLVAGGASAEPDRLHQFPGRLDDHAGQVEPGDLHEPLVRLPHVPAGVDGDAVDAPVVVLEVRQMRPTIAEIRRHLLQECPGGRAGVDHALTPKGQLSRRGRYISASGAVTPLLTASSRACHARIAATQASILREL